MPNLDQFFEGCEIPPYVWKNAQEHSKIEPAEVAEYSAMSKLYAYGGLVIINHYIGKLSTFRLALRA